MWRRLVILALITAHLGMGVGFGGVITLCALTLEVCPDSAGNRESDCKSRSCCHEDETGESKSGCCFTVAADGSEYLYPEYPKVPPILFAGSLCAEGHTGLLLCLPRGGTLVSAFPGPPPEAGSEILIRVQRHLI